MTKKNKTSNNEFNEKESDIKEKIKRILDDDFDREETFYCLFPIIREKISNNDYYYYPLFVLNFSAKIGDIIMPIFESNGNNNFYSFCFNTATLTNFVVCKPVFINIFKMDIDEFDSLDTKKPLLTFIVTELLKEEKVENLDFATAFLNLKDYCKRTLKVYYPFGKFELWNKDFIILDSKLEIIESVKIKKQLNVLKKDEFDPEKFPNSAAYRYLYEKQQISFEDYNKADDTIWYGTFHSFELSHGQGILLQKLAKGENLIAVQGPPGTGKTTILMSIIANILTERAINIAKGGEDYSTLILVASTANKAVENAAREFIDADKNPQLKKLPIYTNDGFYFIGGKKENISASIGKVSNFITHLENIQWNQQLEEKYQNLKEEILQNYYEFMDSLNTLKDLKNKYSDLKNKMLIEISKLSDLNYDTSDIDKIINDITKKIINFEEKYKLHARDNLKLLVDIIDRYEKWEKQILNMNLDKTKLVELKNSQQFSTFYEDFLRLSSKLKNKTLIEKILSLFVNKDKILIENFVLKYRKLFEMLSFNPTELLNCKVFKNSMPEIEKLINFIEEPLPHDFFVNEETIENLKTYLLSFNLIQVKEQLAEIEQCEHFKWINDKAGIFKFWKSNYEKTKNLFLLASEFLYLYALKNRAYII
ncbi:AAA domain-containing protein [Thermodesulfovibrio sp. 3907-1M]|uniref:AAA domain-containing protein n=1 Tax=Thermodesulfovibrio autotrophicus TaxID=3118333 RepID=A0AAU8H028_9BACT